MVKFITLVAGSLLIQISLFGGVHSIRESEKVALKDKSIYIAASASGEVRDIALKLAATLEKITRTNHPLQSTEEKGAILLEIVEAKQIGLKDADIGARQGYSISTSSNAIRIQGASLQGLRNGCADFLYHLGLRHYLPGGKWSVVPEDPNAVFRWTILESPDFYTRHVSPVRSEDEVEWCEFNRAAGFGLYTSHVFQAIYRKNKKLFDKHPEYLALVDGKRVSDKFCISNPEARKVIIQFVLGYFKLHPDADSCSIEPSDGGNWCTCEECKKIGSPSDRMAFLSEECSTALDAEYPGKKVAFYAYFFHSPPPKRPVGKNTIVSVATAITTGGFSIEELLKGWKNAGAELGIRDYGAVFLWTWELPGAGGVTNLKKYAANKKQYYEFGARYYIDNMTLGWGAPGLGYYINSRCAWNVGEGDKIDSLVNEFLMLLFGPARDVMRSFYAQLDGGRKTLLSEDVIGRMYRALDQAYELAGNDEKIAARLDDLAILTRYSELTMKWRQKPSDMVNLNSLEEFLFANQSSNMFSFARAISGIKRLLKNHKVNPRPEREVSRKELRETVKRGIEENSLIPFETVAFDENTLRPVETKAAISAPSIFEMRGNRSLLLYLTKPETFKAVNGLIKHYRNRGNLKIELYKIGAPEDSDLPGDNETLVWNDESVPPDGVERVLTLPVKSAGLYRLTVNDGQDRSRLTFSPELPVVFNTQSSQQNLSGNCFFFVPKGTETIGFYTACRGLLSSPDKAIRFNLRTAGPGYHAIPVPQGMDGKIWCIEGMSGVLTLLTVPPFLACSESSLMIPSEKTK